MCRRSSGGRISRNGERVDFAMVVDVFKELSLSVNL